MPWIGTLKDRKLADPSLRFPHLAIVKRPNPLGGGASDSDAPYLGTARSGSTLRADRLDGHCFHWVLLAALCWSRVTSAVEIAACSRLASCASPMQVCMNTPSLTLETRKS